MQADGAEEPGGDPLAEGHFLLDGVFLRRLLDLGRDFDGLLAQVEEAPEVELRMGGDREGEREHREERSHEPPPV